MVIMYKVQTILFVFLLINGYTYIYASEPILIQSCLELDYWPTNGWNNCTPEEQGMNSTRLQEMVELLQRIDFGVDSILIVRNGYIVFERYLNTSYGKDVIYPLRTCTSTVTSILTGIALDEGAISNISQNVLGCFPDRVFQSVDSRKQAMTIEHLLMMMSGVGFNEQFVPYDDPRNDYYQMMNSLDPVQYFLDLRMSHEPGTNWVYNSGGAHILSAIIEETTNQNTLAYAREHLFEPLGISNIQWDSDNQGVSCGGFGLSLTPRDMAKIGHLYLNNGTWDTQQIVSKDWVNASSQIQHQMSVDHGYGYGWWMMPEFGICEARDILGLRIALFPQHNVVAVFASYNTGLNPFDHILPHYVGKAAEDNVTIPTKNNTTSNGDVFDYFTVSVAAAIMVPLLLGVVIWLKRKH